MVPKFGSHSSRAYTHVNARELMEVPEWMEQEEYTCW